MYVRSKDITTGVVLPPQMQVQGGVHTVTFGLLVSPTYPSGRSLKDLVERLRQTLLVHMVYSCMLL